MKVNYDESTDALYVRLADSKIIESEEIRPGFVLDFDADGQVVGFEMLDLLRRLPCADPRHVELSVG